MPLLAALAALLVLVLLGLISLVFSHVPSPLYPYWLEQLVDRVRTDVTRNRVSVPAVAGVAPTLRLSAAAPAVVRPVEPPALAPVEPPPVAAPPLPVPLVPVEGRSVVEPPPPADAIIVRVT